MGLLDRLWTLARGDSLGPVNPPVPPAPPAPATETLPPGVVVGLTSLSAPDRRAVLLREVLLSVVARMDARQGVPSGPAALVILLAIAGQESDIKARRQLGGGPARGLWQFERGGGVVGVLTHYSTRARAAQWCEWRGVAPTAEAVHAALEVDDVLGAAFARLLLWTDPKPLPADEGGAWRLYERVWRPGRPHPDRWAENWRLALAAVV